LQAGYLKLGVDPVVLLKLDPKRNSDMSQAVFQELMILQKHGWPDDEDAALEAEQREQEQNGSGGGVGSSTDQNAAAAAALRSLSASGDLGGGSGGGGGGEPLEPLRVNQLVRAALRPGGHFYNGRITSTNADGSMCGVAFFDGDKVDALPRALIVAAPSPSKKTALQSLSASGDLGGGSGGEPLEPLHVNQLVRAALRPGGHFYNGRITSANADGSMYGVAFFDGDKVDALPRALIVAAPSPTKKTAEPTPGPESTLEPKKPGSENNIQKANSRRPPEPEPSLAPAPLPPKPTVPKEEAARPQQLRASAPLPPRPASPAGSDSSDDFAASTDANASDEQGTSASPSSRPSTRRGRDEAIRNIQMKKPLPPRPASARPHRPTRVAPPGVPMTAAEAEASATTAASASSSSRSHVNFTNVSNAGGRTPPRTAAPPIVTADTSGLQAQLSSNYPTRAEFERQSTEVRQDQRAKSRRKRPKSANPRGRSRRVKESFIERNKRMVSEMSRRIVRPDPPPPPPSEPDEDESRRRRQQRRKQGSTDGKPGVRLFVFCQKVFFKNPPPLPAPHAPKKTVDTVEIQTH
jgi:hypothetical protein